MYSLLFSKKHLESHERLLKIVEEYNVDMSAYLTRSFFNNLDSFRSGDIDNTLTFGDVIGTDAVMQYSHDYLTRDPGVRIKKYPIVTQLPYCDFDWNSWCREQYGLFDPLTSDVKDPNGWALTKLWYWLFSHDFSLIKKREGNLPNLDIFTIASQLDELFVTKSFSTLILDSWVDENYTEKVWFPLRMMIFREHAIGSL